MNAIEPTQSADKSKTVATWTAIVAGGLGLHRFYLHGFRDLLGWLYPLPTLIGLYGVMRARSLGQDDQLAWVLIPFVGCTIAASMLCAIVYGLTSDDKWNARFNVGRTASRSGWAAVLGAMLGLLVGAGVLMATIAFVAQRYFEYQAETEAQSLSQPATPTVPPPTTAAY
ncbi:MAG: NINE protein [Burkholderiales bacterium]